MSDLVHDLGRGLAGTALRQAVLAHNSGRWEAAHAAAKAMTAQPVSMHDASASLYRGAPAVAYALHTASHRAYQAALHVLDEQIATLVKSRLTDAHRRMDTQVPPRLREYDLISGLTGLGAYVLSRGSRPDLLQGVLRYLVRLIEEPVIAHGRWMPGWWTSDGPKRQPDKSWPPGHANFGMAHGVSGPIALLALSTRAGHEVPGQRRVLEQACDLLGDWAQPEAGSGCWPEIVGLDQWLRGPSRQPQPGRPSWCYGTPGIARSLQLAALACQRPTTQRLAEDALASCSEDPEQVGRFQDATVCHGWAGLCLALDRAANDAGPDSVLHQHRATAQARLTALMERSAPPPAPGLLTGADGILLTLHTLTPAHGVSPGWDTCLLLT